MNRLPILIVALICSAALLISGAAYYFERAFDRFTGEVIDIAGAPATIHHDDGTVTHVPVNYQLYARFHRPIPDKFKQQPPTKESESSQ